MGSTARIRQIILKSKAVLCVLLVLNLHAWIAGCTGPAEITAPLTGILRVDLSADHALTKALNNSVLIGAEAFEIDPVRKTFRIIFAETNREVTGTYAVTNGAFTITQFTFGRFGRSVTMSLDLSKRVQTIVTDNGFHWQRPGNWPLVAPSSDGVDGYVEANARLLDIAKGVEQGQTSTPGNGTTNPGGDFDAELSALIGNKINSADAGLLLQILGTILAIWGPILGMLTALLSIFLVIALIQALIGDLDGSAPRLPPPLPNDEPPPVDPVPPDNSISLSVTASQNWTYEHLVFEGTPVNNCEVSFVATVGNDTLRNSGYTYVWTIAPPADRSSAAFTPVSGETTANPTFLPAARPASSINDYIVTVVATGNDRGNTGSAMTTIKVRLLGDVDDSGCVDLADIAFVADVEAGNLTGPENVRQADVNCDGTTDFVLDANLIDFVRLNLDGQGNGSCN